MAVCIVSGVVTAASARALIGSGRASTSPGASSCVRRCRALGRALSSVVSVAPASASSRFLRLPPAPFGWVARFAAAGAGAGAGVAGASSSAPPSPSASASASASARHFDASSSLRLPQASHSGFDSFSHMWCSHSVTLFVSYVIASADAFP